MTPLRAAPLRVALLASLLRALCACTSTAASTPTPAPVPGTPAHAHPRPSPAPDVPPVRLDASTVSTATTALPVTAVAPVERPARAEPSALAPVRPTGCPPPPRTRAQRVHPPRWRPPHLVPQAALPLPAPPAPRTASLRALEGAGVWIWRVRQCEGGDAEAIVARAVREGVQQLWVRVGDSRDGFYGSATLDGLVPRAHAAGLAVIGWGFPYLYDPAADAGWTVSALAWRGPDGAMLDGFSPDIESASEGTALSARRAVLYLSLVRPVAARSGRPLVATVFRPTVQRLRGYPYAAMAPYVDAFAPMVYWSCNEPGALARDSVRWLTALAPVHLIGQGYDMTDEGGRVGVPSGREVARFCDAGRRAGAVGASLWHWGELTADAWHALGTSWWPAPGVRR